MTAGDRVFARVSPAAEWTAGVLERDYVIRTSTTDTLEYWIVLLDTGEKISTVSKNVRTEVEHARVLMVQ